ncbi:MAG: FG-GAP repeat domain-containing protein [Planctomycetaceae bacterium]
MVRIRLFALLLLLTAALGAEPLEEAVESFANSMHLLSGRLAARDLEGAAAWFHDELVGTLPEMEFPSMERVAPGILEGRAKPGPLDHAIPRARLLERLALFLALLPVTEEVRIKVPEARAREDGSLEGTLKLALVGRDALGRRAWLRTSPPFRALRDAGGAWRLEAWGPSPLQAMAAERDLFTEVAARAGLYDTDPPVTEHPTLGLAAYGAAAGDFDGDGRIDLVCCGTRGTRLYRNLGDGRFEDVAAAAGLASIVATAPLFLDYDNDGDSDLFFTANGKQRLFENRLLPDGAPRFLDVSAKAGVGIASVAFSAAAGDVDGNGFPDLYVTCYNLMGPVLPDRWDAATNGLPNLLFMNQGDGTFREEAAARGVADARWSYAAQFCDLDGEGDLDLYVANDFGGGCRLYLNEGGKFRDAASERGAADSGHAMGVCFSDYDNDGLLDLHLSRMSSTAGRRILARYAPGALPFQERLEAQAAGNGLYRNLGEGRFTEVSADAGPFAGGWAWGGGFLDIDNDGFEDLHVPNGFLSGSSLEDT